MRFLKAVFNKATITAFVILLQICFLLLFFTVFEMYYLPARIVLLILGILVCLKIINQKNNPDYKIPWLILILTLPVIGIPLYFMFADMPLSRKHMNLFGRIDEKMRKTFGDYNNYFESFDDSLARQSNYIYSTCRIPAYTNTETEYFGDGEEAFESILSDVRKAESFVLLEFFIVQQGYMWNTLLEELKKCVGRGVKVYMMYDDLGCIRKLPSNYYKRLNEYGIKCVKFNKFLPIVSEVHNNRDHRKILVVDGVVGYTGGMNLADEYVNRISRFGHWKDFLVRIKGDGVQGLTMIFLQLYQLSVREDLDFNYFIRHSDVKSESVVHPYCDGPKPLNDEQIGETVYMNMISAAKRYVYIMTPYLIVDYNFTDCLITAAKRGVDVRIIVPGIPDKKIVYIMTKSSLKSLVDAGVGIYIYKPGFIHSKVMLYDDEAFVAGTVNLDYRSFVHHYECGVLVRDESAIKSVYDDFVNTFSVCEKQTSDSVKMGFWGKFVSSVLKIFAPLM